MATTQTPRLKFRKQDLGDNPGTWPNAMEAGFDDADAKILLVSSDFVLGATQIETVSFTGSGLNDLSTSGTYTGGRDRKYIVEVEDASQSPDTFRWSDDGGISWTSGVNMSATPIVLSNGVSVAWGAVEGHTDGDRWEFWTRSLEREDPNNIDGNGASQDADYVGQRYFHELDKVWWVATATGAGTSVWVREGTVLSGNLASRPPANALPDGVTFVSLDDAKIYAVDSGAWKEISPQFTTRQLPPMFIHGLNVAGAVANISVGQGQCRSSDDTVNMILTAASMTKAANSSGNWSSGDSGNMIPNAILPLVDDAWYRLFLISNDDGSVVDFGLDNNENATNLLAASGLTKKRRIFWLKAEPGSDAFYDYNHYVEENLVRWAPTPKADFSDPSPIDSSSHRFIGLEFVPEYCSFFGSVGFTDGEGGQILSINHTDQSGSWSAGPHLNAGAAAIVDNFGTQAGTFVAMPVDNSSGIRVKSNSNNTIRVYVNVSSYYDLRTRE